VNRESWIVNRERRVGAGAEVELSGGIPSPTKPMQPITDESGWARVAALPMALLLKHGARCPISANARDEVTSFCARHPEVEVFAIEVTAHRELSRQIAGTLDIEHASPQVLLLRGGKAGWYAEHYEISAAEIEAQLRAG
jgi:bacillithiol system protein YtxJ